MSVIGIASSILSSLSGTQNQQNSVQQIRSEFKQLGQDLQEGNLPQAQSDFTALSKNLSSLLQNGSGSNTNVTSGSPATGTDPVAQVFAKLGADLQSGNLQAAQQDFTTIQKDATQVSGQVSGHREHHRHHHTEKSEESSSSRQSNPINQDFGHLAQDLKSGNLQGAQSDFAKLQNDLQQIGGFSSRPSSSTASATAPATAGSLNVTV